MKIARYFKNIGTALSQFANAVVLFGDPDESISGRSYSKGTLDGSRIWYSIGKGINKMFFWDEDHIKVSYYQDIDRARRIIEEHESR